MPDVPIAVLVGEVVDEELRVDVDLVRRQPAPLGDPHRREEVVDQLAPARDAVLGHGPARAVQDLLAVLRDAPRRAPPYLVGQHTKTVLCKV
nr:hypothetical protein [Kribbella speibonae]